MVLTIFMFLLVIAALFGLAVIAGSIGLLFFRRLRPWALAAISGGMLGAGFAFAMFALATLLRDHDHRQLFSQVAATIVSAGFGPGALCGSVAFFLFRFMRTPNRWADRHRKPIDLTRA